jgi:hypothetical protein
MPRGVYERKKPAEGGAVGGGESPVRGPIKEMLAGGDEKSFLESLPEQTSTETDSLSPEESTPRRKRRTKAEMAKDANAAPVDMRLERAKSKAAGLGAAKLVESGFAAASKPLDEQEKEDLDDQFYLIANKAGIDPSGSWLFLVLYTIALLGRLVLKRTELGEEVGDFIKGIFEPKTEASMEPEPTGEVSQPQA